MKHIVLFFWLFFTMSYNHWIFANDMEKKLQGLRWEVRNFSGTVKCVTTEPYNIFGILYENGHIPDPFVGVNESKMDWVGKEDWIFETFFDLDTVDLKKSHIRINFPSLDTHCEVFLNGIRLGVSSNMFFEVQYNIKEYAQIKGNHLKILFHSPVQRALSLQKKYPVKLPGGERVHLRKAQYHFGWDWGPTLPGCGIAKLPTLSTWDNWIVKNVYVKANPELDEQNLQLFMEIEADQESELSCSVEVNETLVSQKIHLLKGKNTYTIKTHIHQPKLWWTHDLGQPFLYAYDLKISDQHEYFQKLGHIGFRTIKLQNPPIKGGQDFYFTLNNQKIFCKGANYIPATIMGPRVESLNEVETVKQAFEANMNMLRVWGGGIYESDEFYDNCDQLGILVWQDFMYACAMYPGDPAFLHTAEKEAIYQVKRLRNHPCLALFCGNNENNEAWHRWGWKPSFLPHQQKKIWDDYQQIFNRLLPNIVNDHAPDISYWESSPKYGRGDERYLTDGDAHDWWVWHDGRPFRHFLTSVPRFMSEFGFQSFPDMSTIALFADSSEFNINSPTLLQHQKHPKGNAIIDDFVKRDFPNPKGFEGFVYLSQLVQAEGMSLGIETHLRHQPECNGTLFWQLNDCWPVASWSAMDYTGSWKAMMYRVKDIFEDKVVSTFINDRDQMEVHYITSTPTKSTMTATIQLLDFEGKVHKIWQESFEDTINSNKVLELPLKELRTEYIPSEHLMYVFITNNQGLEQTSKFQYLLSSKYLVLNPPKIKLESTFIESDQCFEMKLTAISLAKNVLLTSSVKGKFSDNYFDLLPGMGRKIYFHPKENFIVPPVFEAKSMFDFITK